MAYYVMVGEGSYPVAAIEEIRREHLKRKSWLDGTYLDLDIPEPIIYELEEDEYDEVPNIRPLSKGLPIPFMHNTLYEALRAAGVDNLQVFDAVIIDKKRGIEYRDYKAFNIVGTVAAADLGGSTMMGTSESDLIDVDFDRLVLDEKKCAGFLLFRLAENITAIIVSEAVKNEVERRGIKGIFFYASGEWSG
jgi:hypothetical protein